MRRFPALWLAGLLCLPTAVSAQGDPSEQLNIVISDGLRIVIVEPFVPDDIGKWEVTFEVSRMTDDQNVTLWLESNEALRGPRGRPAAARLLLRCTEKTTSIALAFEGLTVASAAGHGLVEYRVDKGKMQRIEMSHNTSFEALGLWRSADALPFVRSLFAHDELLVRVTPVAGNPVIVSFPITRVEAAAVPLREACGW